MKITAVCSPLLLVSWLVQQTYHSLNVYFKISSGADAENSGREGQKNCSRVQATPFPLKIQLKIFPSKDGWSI